MNPIITDDELYVALKLHSEPLRRIEDDGNELWVGTWSLSKKRPVFRSGYGYQLHADAHFTKLPFDVEGQRGFGIVFWSQGDPAWYFTGWVEDHREDEADAWVTFLNDEIARRHRGEPPGAIPNARDGRAAQDAEDAAELRKLQLTRGVKPFRLS